MDIKSLIDQRQGEHLDLHKRHVNPALARVLQIIGYDVTYARGEGPYLFDQGGNRYLDFLGGYGVYQLGRSHPELKKVLCDLLDVDRPNLIQMDCPLLAGLLAERLTARAKEAYPGLDAVFFTNSGAESVEGSLKFARAATRRERFVYLEHAFHGLTLGALSVNGSEHFRSGFGALLPATAVPLNDLDALARELSRGDVAALIAEPIQGKGVYMPDPGFLPEAQRLCRKHGTVFIVDEVQTGLGRTGRFFGGEQWGLDPDVVTVSKALSGGYIPVGAVLLRRELHKKTFSGLERCVVHSNTFGMNELAMGAGLATLEVLDRDGLIDNAARQGEKLLSALHEMQGRYEMLHHVRGKGLMIGLEFGPPSSLRLKAAWTALETMQAGLFAQLVVMDLMHERRVLSQVSGHRVNIVKFLPPLVLRDADVEEAIAAIDATLGRAHRLRGGLWEMGKDLVRAALKR
jgi:acetylornithine/succinyldiaminopimelate/putrescine aminotransferase